MDNETNVAPAATPKPALDWDDVVNATPPHTHSIKCPEGHEWPATPGSGQWTFCARCALGYSSTALTLTPVAPVTKPSEPWEVELTEGWHLGYMDMREERKSTKGDFTMWVFRVEEGERRGRYTYYVGHRRAEELATTRKRLALNPYCWVLLTKKPNVKGMVLERLDMERKVVVP